MKTKKLVDQEKAHRTVSYQKMRKKEDALHQNANLGGINSGIIFLDSKGIITYFNQKAVDVIQSISLEQSFGENAWMDQSITELMKGALEFKFFTPKGFFRWIKCDRRSESDKEENPAAQVKNFISTAEKKNTLADMNADKVFIEKIINANPNIIFIYDIENEIPIYTKPGIKKLFGFSDEDIRSMGSKLIEFVMHPDDLVQFRKNYEKMYPAFKETNVPEIDTSLKRKKGQWKYLLSKDYVFSQNPDGSIAQIFAVITDVTDLIKKKKIKQTMAEHSQMILDSVTKLITIYDREKGIQFVNSTAQQNAGVSNQDFINSRNEEVLPEQIVKVYKKTMEYVYMYPGKHELVDKKFFSDCREFFIRISCLPAWTRMEDIWK